MIRNITYLIFAILLLGLGYMIYDKYYVVKPVKKVIEYRNIIINEKIKEYELIIDSLYKTNNKLITIINQKNESIKDLSKKREKIDIPEITTDEELYYAIEYLKSLKR